MQIVAGLPNAAGIALPPGLRHSWRERTVRSAARVDNNHADIKGWFLELGCSILDLSRVGGGCPDLAVSVCKGQTLLVECKSRKGTLTEDQEDFIAHCKDDVIIVRTQDDCIAAVKMARSRAYLARMNAI